MKPNMAETTINPLTDGQWQCNDCGNTKGVVSGMCKKCGPTQTTPKDDTALVIAGAKTMEEASMKDHRLMTSKEAESAQD